jgi:hypothetical protein
MICPECSTPLRRDGKHLNGDDSTACGLNELLRRIREEVLEQKAAGS